MTRSADDTVTLLRELWADMCAPRRDRTAGNIPLYREPEPVRDQQADERRTP